MLAIGQKGLGIKICNEDSIKEVAKEPGNKGMAGSNKALLDYKDKLHVVQAGEGELVDRNSLSSCY